MLIMKIGNIKGQNRKSRARRSMTDVLSFNILSGCALKNTSKK